MFELLNNIRFDEHFSVKSLFRRRCVFICEHPIEDDSPCEYKTLHYHGIVELPKFGCFDNDQVILDIKKQTTFLKSEKAIAPVKILAYMQIQPLHILLQNTHTEHSLLNFLVSEATSELIESIKQKKLLKLQQETSINEDIIQLMKLLRKQERRVNRNLLTIFTRTQAVEK